MTNGKNKLHKREFLNRVSASTGLPVDMVRAVYESIWDELKRSILEGYEISFTGIGTFMLKKYGGRPSSFKKNQSAVSDYYVLKFSASDVINQYFRRAMRERELEERKSAKYQK